MEVLSVLVDPILPVFAILAFGFVLGRRGSITIEDARVINRFAMSVLLPILIFGVLIDAPIREFETRPFLIYVAGEAVIFAIGFLLAHRVFAREAGEAVLLAFCGIFANNVFYGLPIMVILYGPENVLPVTSVITLDSTLTFGGALIALQIIRLGRVTPARLARTILGTPILQAMILGLIVNLAAVEIPKPVETFIGFNGAAGAPVALFALGVVMSQTVFRAEATVITFTLIKLFLFPAVIAIGLLYGAPGAPGTAQYVMASAGPAGAMAFSLALLHGIRTDAIAQVIVWTSLFTLITLALLA